MYDAIVIGLGSMGSSALYHLAKSGLKVLGIEQFGISHEKGSHSGHTRIVRKAYFEHPDYVPLLESAYSGWDELESASGLNLFHKTGLAYFGNSNHPVLEGVKESSKLYDIPLHINSKDEFKQFQIDSSFEILFEPNAGFVLTESTIKTLIQLAETHGAGVQINEQVIEVNKHSDHVKVKTTNGAYTANKVILATGAYLNSLVDAPNIQLSVTRQLIFWIEPKLSSDYQVGNFPSWMIADEGFPGVFYGFPIIPEGQPGGNGLLKVAHHTMGEPIEPKNLQDYDSEEEKMNIESILNKYIPNALGKIKSVSACMYANSSDDNFIIDFLPDSNKNIILAAGFSGHGFKFVPVIGEILRDLVIDSQTNHPIEFLNLNRFK